jgi:hypothetical protein
MSTRERASSTSSLDNDTLRRRPGPVFSTMTCVVTSCLSALLLPPLLLLLLTSSADEQVRVASAPLDCVQPTAPLHAQRNPGSSGPELRCSFCVGLLRASPRRLARDRYSTVIVCGDDEDERSLAACRWALGHIISEREHVSFVLLPATCITRAHACAGRSAVLYHVCMHAQLGAGSPIPGLSASASRASVANAANATMWVAALPPLPSLSLDACRCSAVPVMMAHQHREHDRLGATVAVTPYKSSIILKVASRCRRCCDMPL